MTALLPRCGIALLFVMFIISPAAAQRTSRPRLPACTGSRRSYRQVECQRAASTL